MQKSITYLHVLTGVRERGCTMSCWSCSETLVNLDAWPPWPVEHCWSASVVTGDADVLLEAGLATSQQPSSASTGLALA